MAFPPNELDLDYFLLSAVQLLLTSGVGAVFILNFATKDIFLREDTQMDNEPRFSTDYDELMWLAERQKQHLDSRETRRFFQLRREWSEMHASPATGGTRPYAGTGALSV